MTIAETHPNRRISDGVSDGSVGSVGAGSRLKESQPLRCPVCGLEGRPHPEGPFSRDGIRYLTDDAKVQRFLCPRCDCRFSEDKVTKKIDFTHTDKTNNSLNTSCAVINNSQICALGAKNLVTATEIKTVAGETPQPEAKGKLIQYEIWAQKEGLAEATITRRYKLLNVLLKRGTNLLDSESVKENIAKQNSWNNKTKQLAVEAYTSFLRSFGQTWNPPKYMQVRKLPFLPVEREIDDLIAGLNPKTATFARLEKETGARLGEAWGLEWIDFDFENKSVNLTPEKGSNPRKLPISDKLILMLNSLPKDGQKVFQGSLRHFVRGYRRQRKRIAFKLKNDRINKISFKTFRTFKASMEIAKHRTLKEVQYMLGHKSIVSTDYYVQLVNFGSDDYTSQAAKTVEEAQKLIEAGFEYVCSFEDVKLFRKRK
jgi:integrase